MYLREFNGGVFSERIEGGRAGATVELSQTEITAITPDGQRFSLPFSNCQLDIGGESGRMIFCRNQDRSLTIFCDDKSLPEALSVASFGLLDDQLKNFGCGPASRMAARFCLEERSDYIVRI
jgi:beta-barrel assembly-enhancing protease